MIISHIIKTKREKFRKNREEKRRLKIPRVDADAPLGLKIGNWVKLSATFAYSIHENSILNESFFQCFTGNGVEINNYSKGKVGSDTFHRIFVSDPETGQEFLIQAVTDQKGNLYKDDIYILALITEFSPETQEYYDVYMAEERGAIGNPEIRVQYGETEDEAVNYYTLTGNSAEWSHPLEYDEMLYCDPREDADLKFHHFFNLFYRPLTEDQETKEFSLITANHIHEDPLNDDYDRVTMLTYVGTKISVDDLKILDVAS